MQQVDAGAQHQHGLAVTELVADELEDVCVARERCNARLAVGHHQRVEQEARLVLEAAISTPSAVATAPMRGAAKRGTAPCANKAA